MELPRCNEFGSYLLPHRTAIYPSKVLKGGAVAFTGNYYVRLKGQFVFEGPGLKLFASPEAALKFIEGEL